MCYFSRLLYLLYINMDWQDYKVRNTNIEGARAAFEKDCATLFNVIYKDQNVKTVKISIGDGGIDVFVGNIGIEPIIVIQCKFFLEDFDASQRQQIKKSFNTAINSNEYKIEEWILCFPRTLDLKQNKWWCEWADKMKSTHTLKDNFIKLYDGDYLINLFKTFNLFNQVFKLEDSLKIADINKKVDDIHKTLTEDISFNEANANSIIQFISTTIDSENCGWESYKNIQNAFQAVNLKSLFPIFNFSLINNSDKTILLTNIVITNKHLPAGLNGAYPPLPNILRPRITYKIKLPSDGKTLNTLLADEIEIFPGRAFKFQVELYSESMDDFSPLNKYALNLKFGFNNDFYIDIPKILLNSKNDSDKLQHIGYN
jgi:hypothetical protein